MKKYLPIYIYGAIIIFVGVFLFISEDNSFNIVQLILGISLIVAAIFAAFSRQNNRVQFAYHELHALTMMVYGVSVLLFCNTFDKLILFTAFIFMFYAFSEIIFCNWLFELERRVVTKILVIRLILGLIIGVGTVFAMNFSKFTLEIFGILFILVGVNVLFYVPVMRKKRLSDISKGLQK